MTDSSQPPKKKKPYGFAKGRGKAGGRKPKPAQPTIEADARRTAMAVLKALMGDAKPILEHVYADNEHYQALDVRDQGFVRQLVMTTLRHLGVVDQLLKSRLSRPIPAKYADVKWVLRLGVVQMLWMRVPDYAAVNSSVMLAKQCKMLVHVPLVNAVLSGIVREREEVMDFVQQDMRYVLPLWLWRRWSVQYGEEKARLMAASLLHEPMLDFTLHPAHTVDAQELEAQVLPSGSLRRTLSGTDVPQLAGFAEGAWWVQDAAAAMPVRFLGDLAGKTVIDACAAPGGKTAQLASAGAQVIALDVAAVRLARLRENMRRLKLEDQVQVVCADALEWQPDAPVDAVVLDAPCSATGTLRRHPEGLWQKKEEDVARLALLQHDLLHAALSWLKPKGVLIYITCSLEQEEGEQQIERVLSERTDIELLPITQREAVTFGVPKQWLNKKGMLRILPHYWQEYGFVDGFFVARLRKV
jgi:16S rRNA (cytosine967-C5)-methyltransferase